MPSALTVTINCDTPAIRSWAAELLEEVARHAVHIGSEIVVMAPAYGCNARGTSAIQEKLSEMVAAIRACGEELRR